MAVSLTLANALCRPPEPSAAAVEDVEGDLGWCEEGEEEGSDDGETEERQVREEDGG